MAEAKPLTKRQQEILALLKKNQTPVQIAKKLGLTSANGIYQTRRRLIAAGHLPKARASRVASSGRKSARKRAAHTGVVHLGTALDGGGSGPQPSSIPEIGTDPVDPVEVIRTRIGVVHGEVARLSSLMLEAEETLTGLGDEAKRLEKALHALVPSSNGTGRRTTARKRGARKTAAATA